MRFKAPDTVSGVSHRGVSAQVKDGYVEIETALVEDIPELQAHGLVFSPMVDKEPDKDDDEKESVCLRLEALGKKADRRKNIAALRELLALAEAEAT